MTASTELRATEKPLRLWPGVAALVLQWFFRFGLPKIAPENRVIYFGVMAAAVMGLVIVLWWLFFSRARWSERLVAVGLMVWQQYLIRDREPAKCFQAFLNNHWLGMAWFIGVFLDYQLGALT